MTENFVRAFLCDVKNAKELSDLLPDFSRSADEKRNRVLLDKLLREGGTEQELWSFLIGCTTTLNVDQALAILTDELKESLVVYLNNDREVMNDNGHRPPGLAILRVRLIDSPSLFTRFIRDNGVIVEQMVMRVSMFKSEKLQWCQDPFYRLKREREVEVLVGSSSYRLLLGVPEAAFSDSVPDLLTHFASRYPGCLFSIVSGSGIPIMATAVTTEEMPWEEVVHPLSFIDTACRPPVDLPVEVPLKISEVVRANSPAVSIALQNPPDSIPELFDLLDFCSHFAAMVLLYGEHVGSKRVNVFEKVGLLAHPFR